MGRRGPPYKKHHPCILNAIVPVKVYARYHFKGFAVTAPSSGDRAVPSTIPMPPEPPGPASAARHEEPALATLAACHRRLQTHCAALQRLIDPRDGHRPDLPARQAARDAVHGLDTVLQAHHADEELELFPALIDAMAGSDAVCLREMVASLTAEHRDLERRWHRLRPALLGLADGHSAALAVDEARAFVDGCQHHIAREDAELLPMAGRLIGDAEMSRLGHALRMRGAPVEGAGAPTIDPVSDWPNPR